MERGAVAAGAQPIDADAAVEVAVRRRATDLRIFKLPVHVGAKSEGKKGRVRVNSWCVRYALAKILVQTQWEAVRFDRVKHTAGTLLEVFSAAVKARAACAILLCGAVTLRAASD